MKKKFLLPALIAVAGVGAGTTYLVTKKDAPPPVPTPPVVTPAKKATGKILILSDIHFNPYYDVSLMPQLIKTDYTGWSKIFESSHNNSFGTTGQDTYYKLFKSGLAAMRNANGQPDLIIINGDFLSHDFGTTYTGMAGPGLNGSDSLRAFVRKTINYVFMMLQESFPNTAILPVLGNNDDYNGDYTVRPDSPFLNYFATSTVPLLGNMIQHDAAATISKGGYYMAAMPWDSSEVFVGLNTVFFSQSYMRNSELSPAQIAAPGLDEIAWLRQTLAMCAAGNKKVWLSYHIPPGIDMYKLNAQHTLAGMWFDQFTDSFIAIVNQYHPTIKANFAGHTHMDEFRLIADGGGATSFIHGTPAVTPNFGNNPAFQELTWQPGSMLLVNSVTYRFGGINATDTTWQREYDFAATYGTSQMDAASLTAVWGKMEHDDSARTRYFRYYPVDNPAKTPTAWKNYWCGMRNLTTVDFKQCTKPTP